MNKRIEIRSFIKFDFDDLKKLLTDPMVVKTTGLRVVQSEERITELLDQWINTSDSHYGKWCVVFRETQEFLGWCMLVNKDGINSPELGYVILQKYWGLGLASEIAENLVVHAKKKLGLKRILAFTDPTNKGSMRVLEKVGFRRSELQENEVGPEGGVVFSLDLVG